MIRQDVRESDGYDPSGIEVLTDPDLRRSAANIPVRNWFYMLLYAWDLGELTRDKELRAKAEHAPDLRALLTSLLAYYTRRQIRRGLRGDYVDLSEPLRTVRGRINLTRTVGDLQLYKGQIHCDYQEYSLNIPRNQIIASTLNRQLLHDYATIESDANEKLGTLKAELESLVRTMSDIDHVRPTERLIADETHKLGRNEREYRLIMQICQWLIRPRMPDEDEAGQRFADIRHLKVESRLFERFVANFYRFHNGADWDVSPQSHQNWNSGQSVSYQDARLPRMEVDIELMSRGEPSQRVIIDTKWYQSVLDRGRSDVAAVHSTNLYQMYAYLASQDHRGPPYDEATGILLYAQPTDENVAFRTRIDRHPFWVHTLDLSQPWENIHCDLMNLIRETAP